MNYFWNNQLHLYQTENPGEFSYSDGAEVEERLLSVVANATDRSTFSQELASAICDWPSEYHFSRFRHCLVRPLDLRAGDEVLELGCGCGAITRFLGEVGANVVAVEGSLTRARVAAERCRELTNVRVVVDDLLRFQTDGLFDCILLIGVLEYAALFSGSEKPFEHYLQAVTRFLKPGGRVVIAIENKVGLKYFNGCGEDHVGIPFFGVQDLYGVRTVRTFGRRELIALLSGTGLSHVRFYYPFPDYKLPSVILSENALTDPGFDAIDLLARCHARDYTGSPYRGFDDALAFSVLHTNGLLAELSNSFLVVATPDNEPRTERPEIAFAWSVNRAPEFCTETSFVRRGSEIRVVKELLTTSDNSRHTVDEGLTITHDVSESVYRRGRQLLWDLLRARAGNGNVESIVRALRPWMEFLLRHARVSTAPIAEVSETPLQLASYMISGDFLDCTLFNLLDIDGELVPIDEEWQSENDVSLGRVVTRGVLWSMPSGMSSGDASPSILELITSLCDSFELAVSEAEIETWLGQEAEFQRIVTGQSSEPLTTGRTFQGMRPFVGEISSLKQTVATLEEEVTNVTRILVEREKQIAQRVASLEQTVAAREEDIARLGDRLDERKKHIAGLEEVVVERDRLQVEISQLKARSSFLNAELTGRTEQLNSVLRSNTWRLTAPLRAIGKLRPRSYRELSRMERDQQLIAQSGLFDANWYLSQNPDVAMHLVNPLAHYLQHGAVEGRDPGPTFSSAWYLEQNPDVRAAGFNPLVHYLRFGAAEGRRPSPVAGPANVRQSVADAQKDWDRLGRARLDQLLLSGDRIVFPATESPIVSIILVFYNKAYLSLLCLGSILETADVPYEVIIVNNCSSDETTSLLERIDGGTIVNNTANLGFGDACMQGAERARGEYVCFLNNDALLQANALSSALLSFGDDSTVGAVGGKILLANGDLQEAGSMLWSDGSALGYGRGDNPDLPQYEFRRPVDYCSGAFLVTTRHLFLELGGFKRIYSPAYYEDCDYCMEVWGAGFKVVYEPRAVIRHYESASSDGNEAAKPAMAANQQKFREKWNDQLLKRLPGSTRNVQSARISASAEGLRILYVEDRIPHRHLGSGFPRSNEILQHLVRQGHHVTCASFTSSLVENEYIDIPRDVELLDGVSQRERLFREYVPNSDIVWVSRPHNMESFLKERTDKVGSGRVRVIYDAEAIFAEREWRHAQLLGSEISSKVKSAWLDRELALAKSADIVVVVSERDRQTMQSGGVHNVSVVGFRVPANPTPASFEERSTFLFVGAMHGTQNPNADSMRYFCDSIWPVIHKATGADLIIAGYGTDRALSDWKVPGVRIVGRQDDLSSLYNEARVFVAPTRYAAGNPYKANEAASFGVPLVVSGLIGEQLGWQHGSDCLVADTPIAFADACCRLHQDETLWQQLRSSALRRVINDLSDEVFGRAIASVIDNISLKGEAQWTMLEH
jgi:GT2 family glycosyltransferase/SAM-dependent methyltransferase